MTWFEDPTGFADVDVDDVAARFLVDGATLTSTVNGRRMRCGTFELASLDELRARLVPPATDAPSTMLVEVVADVRLLHADPINAGAVFQVASRFNSLEMVSPSITPEEGIGRYEHDRTQGPACAVACGAGTIHRNYLVPLAGCLGQCAEIQLDGLADLADRLRIAVEMRNGYAFPTAEQLSEVDRHLGALDETERDQLIGLLRVGVQYGTEVTLAGAGHLVDQVYCSALPVADSRIPAPRWEGFARLVLEGAYEATLAATAARPDRSGRPRVHLTLLGGGVFGNRLPWIIDAIDRAITRYADAGLDVSIVSHGAPRPELRALLDRWGRR